MNSDSSSALYCPRLEMVSDTAMKTAFAQLCGKYTQVCDRLVQNGAIREDDYTRVQQMAHSAFDAGVIPFAFVDYFSKHHDHPVHEHRAQEIIQHSLEVAVLSSRLGMDIYRGDDDMQLLLFTGGLLHDVGKFPETELHTKGNKLFDEEVQSIYQRLAAAYPARDEDTQGVHPVAMAYMHAVKLANERGNEALDPELRNRLQEAYHEGLIIDSEQEGLLNDCGNLTVAQLKQIKNHTVQGYDMLMEHSKTPGDLAHQYAKIALTHHIGYDGRGYPQIAPHIPAEDLIQPEHVRIVQVADVMSALTGKRAYRDGIPVPEVLARFTRPYKRFANGTSNGGMLGQVDPDVVDVLIKLVGCETDALDNYSTSDVPTVTEREKQRQKAA